MREILRLMRSGPFVRSDRAAAWVLAVGALDLGLEQFMLLPALPAIQEAHGTSITTTAWVQTAFLLAAVAAVPLFGRLGDMYGKRRLLLIAIAAFAAGSLVSALASSVGGLIAGRALQGLGAGLGPLAIGIARDRAPRGRAPVWIGLLIATAGAGAAVGLLVGGVLAEAASVSAVFWVLFGVAVVLFVGVMLLVPESPRGTSTRPDWIGSLLLIGALVSFLLAVSKANAWDWSSTKVVILIVASVLVLIAFIAYERSAKEPLLDMHLLARRPAWSANLVAFAMGFALFIAGIVIPQIATLPLVSGYGRGLTYAQTGLILLPGALAIIVGGWACGLLIGRLGARRVATIGALAAAIGYAILAAADRSTAVMVIGNVPIGLGIGLAVAALTNLVVRSVDHGRTSAFAATTAVSRTAGAALGTQIAAAIVISAGVVGRFPADEGFTRALVLGLIAAIVALGATTAIPASSSDPLVERVSSGSKRARSFRQPRPR